LRKPFDDEGTAKTVTVKKNATIQDVANKAKVSISTVSHVINKTRFVEDGTKDRIIAAIEELNYRPNLLARGLRGAGSKTIGLIISDIREEFFSRITKAIESAANERGYMVILCDSEESPVKEASYLEILAARGIDGIILSPVDGGHAPRFPHGWTLPIVLIDRRCRATDLDFFGIDNEKWAEAAVAHFASLGRTRLGFVGYEKNITTMAERASGFVKASRAIGSGEAKPTLTLGSRASGDGKSKITRWLKANPGLEGLICGNANICYEALDALEAMGMRVPDDIGILSFDDPECFRFMRCPITSIRQPTEKIGLAALDALLARAAGERSGAGTEKVLPAKLVVRESCGEARARR
jgi:LacI family transcriptional regulator